MVWLPVIFVCLNSGACFFVHDTTQISEKACAKEVAEMGAKVIKHPDVEGWKGTCIPIKFQQA
jgi:hypothetical protein